MKHFDPMNAHALAKQVQLQKLHAWDMENDIPWSLGVDISKGLLPLDDQAIAFPDATPEQRLALSQLMGLVINATISEMESVLFQLRSVAWEQILQKYPANPEMEQLGELFFEEEAKHSRTFARYIDSFCSATGIRREDLECLLPKAIGSSYLRATVDNARAGGTSFWWGVATVEEVSIKIFQNIAACKDDVDPLFYEIHRRHLEEESRHANYAFLMLNHIYSSEERSLFSVRNFIRKKTDLVNTEVRQAAWVITELAKIFEAERLKHQHPFFATIASALPLLKKLSLPKLAQILFVSSPYISLVLNVGYHKKTTQTARQFGVFRLPLPVPRPKKILPPTKKRSLPCKDSSSSKTSVA